MEAAGKARWGLGNNMKILGLEDTKKTEGINY
jgi:hypothetical protein